MVLAIHPPEYLIKLAEMSVLDLTHFKYSVTSALRRSYLNRKPDPSQHFASMKTHQIASLNMMVNEVHDSMSLKAMSLRSNISSCDIYDKETTKICNQLGSHLMAYQKDERS